MTKLKNSVLWFCMFSDIVGCLRRISKSSGIPLLIWLLEVIRSFVFHFSDYSRSFIGVNGELNLLPLYSWRWLGKVIFKLSQVSNTFLWWSENSQEKEFSSEAFFFLYIPFLLHWTRHSDGIIRLKDED